MKKRALALLLSLSMIMASTITAFAADGSGGSDSPSSESSESTESEDTSSSDDDSSSGEPTEEFTLSDVYAANTPINVGGKVLKITVDGIYAAKSVNGVAPAASKESVAQSMGLTGKQKPYFMIFDTDKKKSNLAMQSINAALNASSGTFITAINMYLGYLENGKYYPGTTGSVQMTVGVPKSALVPGREYFLVAALPLGQTVILEDLDSDTNTVTFNAIPGNIAYALAYK